LEVQLVVPRLDQFIHWDASAYRNYKVDWHVKGQDPCDPSNYERQSKDFEILFMCNSCEMQLNDSEDGIFTLRLCEGFGEKN
jgi:hypothetical protein